MKYILNKININFEDDEVQQEYTRVLTQINYRHHICDISLPEKKLDTFFISLGRKLFYIGETKLIISLIQQHNSGLGSTSTKFTH